MRSGVLWVFPKTWSNRVKPPFLSGLAPQFLNIWDTPTGSAETEADLGSSLAASDSFAASSNACSFLKQTRCFIIFWEITIFEYIFLSKNSSQNQCAHHKVWTSKHLTSQDQHVQLASPCLRARRRSPGWATDTHHTWEFTAPKSKHLFTPSHFFHEARIHLKQLQQSTIKQRNSK